MGMFGTSSESILVESFVPIRVEWVALSWPWGLESDKWSENWVICLRYQLIWGGLRYNPEYSPLVL